MYIKGDETSWESIACIQVVIWFTVMFSRVTVSESVFPSIPFLPFPSPFLSPSFPLPSPSPHSFYSNFKNILCSHTRYPPSDTRRPTLPARVKCDELLNLTLRYLPIYFLTYLSTCLLSLFFILF